MSNANWAYGSTFKIGDGAGSEAFTAVAEVIEITPGGMSRDSIEVTNHASPSGYMEKIPGMRDAGSYTIKMNYLPTDSTQDATTGLREQWDDDVTHNYQLVLQDGTIKESFTGFLINYTADYPLTEQQTLEVEIDITGKPVLTTT